MPSMIYVPVFPQTYPHPVSEHVLTRTALQGVPFARCGDERFHAAYCSTSIYMEAKTLQLHIGESSNSEIAIWHEGEYLHVIYSRILLIRSRLHLSSF